MTDNTEREQFEQWCTTEDAEFDTSKVRNEQLSIEAYRSRETFAAWKGWHARATLPKPTATPAVEGAATIIARVLSNRQADECNIDRDDNWKTYGESYIEDARAVIAALAASPVPMAPSDGDYAKWAERCGAEVGWLDGQMAWVKFHTQTSLDFFCLALQSPPPAASVREQDAKDAARYRWLRANYVPPGDMHKDFDDMDRAVAVGGTVLNDAIDAALSSDTQEGSANG